MASKNCTFMQYQQVDKRGQSSAGWNNLYNNHGEPMRNDYATTTTLSTELSLKIPATSGSVSGKTLNCSLVLYTFAGGKTATMPIQVLSGSTVLGTYNLALTRNEPQQGARGTTYSFSIKLADFSNSETTVILKLGFLTDCYSTTKSNLQFYNGCSASISYVEQTACYWDSNAYISANQSYHVPGSRVYFNWYHGHAGAANAIAGYDVSWQVAGGSSGSFFVSSGSSNGSSYFTLPGDSPRGNAITVSITIRGSSGLNSSTLSSTIGKVNRLPNVPSVNGNPGTLLSYQSHTFTAQSGGDPDGQSVTLQCNSGSGWTNNSSVTFSNPGTYSCSFRAVDSLGEVSGIVNRSVKINHRPYAPKVTGENVSLGANGSYTYNIIPQGDPDSDGITTYVTIDNGSWISVGSSYTISSLGAGTHSISFFSRDALGENSDSVNFSATFAARPNAPTVSGPSNQTLPSYGSYTYNISVSSGLTGYVKVDSGNWSQVGSSFSINKNSYNGNTHTLQFRTLDAYGVDSEIVTRIITFNEKPVINTVQAIIEQLESDSTVPIGRKINLTFTATKTPSSYQVHIYHGQSINSMTKISLNAKNYSQDSKGKISIDISEVEAVKEGEYFKIGLSIKDSYESSDEKVADTVGRKPMPVLAASILKVQNDGNIAVSPDCFKNNVTITIKLPSFSADEGYLHIKKLVLNYRIGDQTIKEIIAEAEPNLTLPSQKEYVHILDLRTVKTGEKVFFSVTTEDSGAYSSTSDYQKGMRKVGPPSFVNDNPITVNPQTILMYENNENKNLSISSSIARNDEGTGNLEYVVKVKYQRGGSFYEKILGRFQGEGYSATFEASFKMLSIAEGKNHIDDNAIWLIDQIIGDNAIKNEEYTITLELIAQDAFNQSAIKEINLLVDYKSAPFFKVEDTISIYHDYNLAAPNNQQLENQKIPVGFATETIEDIRMINPKEKIYLAFPKAKDYNNDITTYLIFERRVKSKTMNDVVTLSKEEKDYLLINRMEALKESQGDNVFTIIAPEVDSNEFVTYMIYAQDSTGKKSSPIFSNTYGIFCRISSASYEVTNFLLNKVGTAGSLKFSYNLTIQNGDIGGSSFIGIKDEQKKEYYRKYCNLERRITSEIENMYTEKLEMQISKNPDFIDKNTATVQTFTSKRGKDGIKYFYDISGENNFTFQNLDPSYFQGKIFVRFILKVPYTYSTTSGGGYTIIYKETPSRVYALYNEEPTVAHRANSVGINTRDIAPEDCLVVSDFGEGKRYVRFIGTDASGRERILLIDLKEGTISGAVVEGGSW